MSYIVLGLSLVVVSIAYSTWRARAAVRTAATSLLHDATILYSGAHEYREVSLTAFPHLDADYYDAARRELEDAGYVWLGDVEDVTVTSAGGHMLPAAARVLVGDEGAVIAAVYHARAKNARRTGDGSHRIAELETPLADGTFVVTSNAALAGTLAQPPEVRAEFRDADTPVATLLARHRARVAELAEAGVAALPTSTLTDALQHQERLDAIKARFRSARPGVSSAEEVQRPAPLGAEATAAKVAAEPARRGPRVSA